jgi:hypothetical protein
MIEGALARISLILKGPGPAITVGLDGGYIRGRDRPPGGTGAIDIIHTLSAAAPYQSHIDAAMAKVKPGFE